MHSCGQAFLPSALHTAALGSLSITDRNLAPHSSLFHARMWATSARPQAPANRT